MSEQSNSGDRFPGSLRAFERARKSIPGGSTRGSTFFRPHPVFAVSAQGCRVRLADGVEVLDYLNNFTSLMLGHGPPVVMDAVRAQLDLGNVYGPPSPLEATLAELLVSRFASVDQAIFTSTGSEAIAAGIRVARAVTGRSKILKFEGGYHGGSDYVKVSGSPAPGSWGDPILPASVADTAGLPRHVTDEVCIAQFNSLESVEAVLSRHHGEIAVLLVEPVLGVAGVIAPAEGFLQGLRELCDRHGVLLLFDEVITQRLAIGGAQEHFGVDADLTVVSKVMSSGFPIGALGGRADIMAAFDNSGPSGALVYHSGTFNGNPLCVCAAIATLGELTSSLLADLDALGHEARERLAVLLRNHRIPACVTGIGSLFNIHFTAAPPTTYREAKTGDTQALATFHRLVLEAGVMLAARGLGCMSSPMAGSEIDELLAAVGWALDTMQA